MILQDDIDYYMDAYDYPDLYYPGDWFSLTAPEQPAFSFQMEQAYYDTLAFQESLMLIMITSIAVGAAFEVVGVFLLTTKSKNIVGRGTEYIPIVTLTVLVYQ